MIFGGAEVKPSPDVISMRIQPDEGIAIRFNAKVPGAGTQIRPVRMEFSYGSAFGEAGPDAYERLLLDVIRGDPTLFTRRDEVGRNGRSCSRSSTSGPIPRYRRHSLCRRVLGP